MNELFNFIGRAKAVDPPPITNIELNNKLLPAFDNLNEGVVKAVNTVLIFASALAIIAIIYSGIMYMTSGGDQEKSEKAKKNLIWAIAGIFIILLSFAIVEFLPKLVNSGGP